MAPLQTFYANVVQVKLTGNELVFEFGAHFPNAPNQPAGAPAGQVAVGLVRPVNVDPDVRVVLSLSSLKSFAQVLQQAVAQVEQAQKQAPSPQPEPLRTTSKQQ